MLKGIHMRPSLGGPIVIGSFLVDIDAKEVFPGGWHGVFSALHFEGGTFIQITSDNFHSREEAEREALFDALTYTARQWKLRYSRQ
jgi:hypothetical protein